eukprot:198602-Prymnesium_polylepis.1
MMTGTSQLRSLYQEDIINFIEFPSFLFLATAYWLCCVAPDGAVIDKGMTPPPNAPPPPYEPPWAPPPSPPWPPPSPTPPTPPSPYEPP